MLSAALRNPEIQKVLEKRMAINQFFLCFIKGEHDLEKIIFDDFPTTYCT